MFSCADIFMFSKGAGIHGGKRARSGRKKFGKTLRVARAFRLSQLFLRNITSCSCREVAKSPSAPHCLGLTRTLSHHNVWKMIYFKIEHIDVAGRFKLYLKLLGLIKERRQFTGYENRHLLMPTFLFWVHPWTSAVAAFLLKNEQAVRTALP